MADIQKGFTFSGSSPNNVATAANLNNLADQATILPSFYTGKPEITSADSGDYALLWDADLNAYRKITVANLVPTATSFRTGFRNLVSFNHAGFETTKIDATADEIVMRTAGGLARYVSLFSGTCTVATYGGASTANGNDGLGTAGALSNGTWYYLFAISTGSVDALLLSNSSSSPVMPAGYTYFAILGTWRTAQASTNLLSQYQKGTTVFVPWPSDALTTNTLNPITGGNEITALTGWGTTLTSIDISRLVSPIASSVQFAFGSVTNISRGGRFSPDSTNAWGDQVQSHVTSGLNFATNPAGKGFYGSSQFSIPVITAGTIYGATFAATANNYSMRISSYTLNL